MSYGARQLIPGVFSPVTNVGKPYSSTLKPEKEKINIFYVNLINGSYISCRAGEKSGKPGSLQDPKETLRSGAGPGGLFGIGRVCRGVSEGTDPETSPKLRVPGPIHPADEGALPK
jgi:hypothetical protein